MQGAVFSGTEATKLVRSIETLSLDKTINWSLCLERLRASESLEALVGVLIPEMWRCAEAAVASSTYAGNVNFLRAVLHLRPDGVYQSMIAYPEGAEEVVTSATLWACIEQCSSGAVAIDVLVGLMDCGLGALKVEQRDVSARNGKETSSPSMQHFLERDTTHIMLVPLRDPAGVLVGMITLEVLCRNAIGTGFVWKECARSLLDLALVACPYLLARPRQARPVELVTNALLPVIGEHMRPVVEMLETFSKSNEVLLISGATGVGKSRIAQWCHAASQQHEQPFERLNLLTIPDNMQMAHLTGWRRGAFTGANRDVEGSLFRAGRGTLFIDEVDKLSLPAQAGLLQILDEREYRVLGSSGKPTQCHVRFIFGTNISLLTAVQRGLFREDLYYRINVLPVALPSLRTRRDEIAAWASVLLSRSVGEAEHSFSIDDEGIKMLENYDWPGNLRQLDNVMRRSLALSRILEPSTRRVSVEAIYRALNMEGERPTEAGKTPLEHAAEFVVDRAIEISEAEPFSLKIIDGFRGLVLEEATRRLGSKEAAFRLFALDNLVQHRNHHSTYRREIKKKEALLDLIERDAPSERRADQSKK